MAAFGINIRAVAEVIFSAEQMTIFRRLTEPTAAWFRNSIRSAVDKLAVRDSLVGIVLAIEAATFVRLYRLKENTEKAWPEYTDNAEEETMGPDEDEEDGEDSWWDLRKSKI